jgi:hypothetical protein
LRFQMAIIQKVYRFEISDYFSLNQLNEIFHLVPSNSYSAINGYT